MSASAPARGLTAIQRHPALDRQVSVKEKATDLIAKIQKMPQGEHGFKQSTINTLGLDIGILASLRERYWMMCYIKNINSPIVGDGISSQYLRRSIDVGIGYSPLDDLRTNLVFNKQIDTNKINTSASISYQLNHMINFVIGLTTNPNRLSAGFALDVRNFDVRYGFMSHPVLNGTHIFELWFFGNLFFRHVF